MAIHEDHNEAAVSGTLEQVRDCGAAGFAVQNVMGALLDNDVGFTA